MNVVLVISIFLFDAFGTSISSISDESPIVITDLGGIRGKILESRLGREFTAFRGIPYAEPPINELRFKVNK